MFKSNERFLHSKQFFIFEINYIFFSKGNKFLLIQLDGDSRSIQIVFCG